MATIKALDKSRILNLKPQVTDTCGILLRKSFDLVEAAPEPMIQLIIAEEMEDKKLSDELEEFLFQHLFPHLDDCYVDVKAYSFTNKIDLKGYFSNPFNDDPDNSNILNGNVIENKIKAIIFILRFIVTLGKIHIPFVSKYACVTCPIPEVYYFEESVEKEQTDAFGAVPLKKAHTVEVQLNLPEEYSLWHEEKIKLERIKKTKDWFFLQVFFDTYEIYTNCEEKVQKIFDETGFRLDHHFSACLEAIELVINGNNDQKIFKKATGITIDEFRYALQKICLRAEESFVFSVNDNADNKPSVLPKITYDSSKAELSVDKFVIKISMSRGIHKILPIICKFINEDKKTEWDWCSVFEQDQGMTPSKRNKKYQRKLYDLYRYLNKEVHKQTMGKVKQIFKPGMKKCVLRLIHS